MSAPVTPPRNASPGRASLRRAPQRYAQDPRQEIVVLADLKLATGVLRIRDPRQCSDLRDAIRVNGGKMPDSFADERDPIVVDQDNVIINGNRRCAAMLAEGITEAPIQRRHFADDRERWQCAHAANAKHGKQLTSKERSHAIIVGEKLGLTAAEMEAVLQFPILRREQRTVITVATREPTPIRPTVAAEAAPPLPDSATRKPVRVRQRTYLPLPVREMFRHRDVATEREAKLMDSLQSPLDALKHCRDIVTLANLGALGSLSADERQIVERTVEVLGEWLTQEPLDVVRPKRTA